MWNMQQRATISQLYLLRYRSSSKKQKGLILDEFVEATGYNRSYARRVLRSQPKVDNRKKRVKKYAPRKRKYDVKVFYNLRTIWIIADQICGKRLQPFLSELIPILERHQEIKLENQVRGKLLTISSATIDRMFSGIRQTITLKGRSATKPGTLLKHQIAVRTFAQWDEDEVGFEEIDLVALCGESVAGEYVNCLDCVDVKTGWVSLEAFFGKLKQRIVRAVDQISQRLPFALKGIDSDNGTEFINGILKGYCEQEEVTFTRSRAYKKNDQCYVEQKNYTTARRWLGYARYETSQQLELVREILPKVERYINFFQPSGKLLSKQRIGSKVKKQYDPAKTPYQRLKALQVLKKAERKKLEDIYLTTNPAQLKREIETLLEKLERTLRYKNS